MLHEILADDGTAKDGQLGLISMLDAAGERPAVVPRLDSGGDIAARIFVAQGRRLCAAGEVEAARSAFEIALSFSSEAAVLAAALESLSASTAHPGASRATSLRDAAAPAGLRFAGTALLN